MDRVWEAFEEMKAHGLLFAYFAWKRASGVVCLSKKQLLQLTITWVGDKLSKLWWYFCSLKKHRCFCLRHSAKSHDLQCDHGWLCAQWGNEQSNQAQEQSWKRLLCWKKLNIEQLLLASPFSDCELEICFRQKCQSPGFFLFRSSVVLGMPVTQRTEVADLVQEMSKYDLMPNLITYSTMIKVQICRECESVICWSWCNDAMYRGIYSYF